MFINGYRALISAHQWRFLTMTYEHAHYNTFGIFGALPTVLSVGDVT
jgi:hypothetical protein